MSETKYFTEEGLERLRSELEQLRTVERPSISHQIAEARDKGDLSENAEYDAAKEAQGLLELKISKLQDKLRNARIIDESKMDSSKALLLSTVTIKNLKNGAQMKYTLVPEDDSDLKKGKISIESPIAKGLLGKEVGDKVEIWQFEGGERIALLQNHALVKQIVFNQGGEAFAAAGEDGNLGDEEITTIIPVIEKLNQQDFNLIGPLPADTLFTKKHLDNADAVLAMYHDQGLPVLKFSGFGKAVNITLGLPFVRTSVDHGTALDLAATGKANANSLMEAIDMAINLTRVG